MSSALGRAAVLREGRASTALPEQNFLHGRFRAAVWAAGAPLSVGTISAFERQPSARPSPRAPIAAHTRRCAMRELRSRPRGRRSLCEAPAGAPAPRCSHIRQNFPAFSPKRRQLLRKRASRSAHFPSGPFENGSISGYRALGGNPKGRAGRQQRAAIHRGSQRS